MELPTWWLAITAVFCFIGAITWLAILFLAFRVDNAIRDLRPKVDEIAANVKSAANKVEGTATMVKDRSEIMLSTVGEAVLTVATRLTMVSTILGIVVAAAKAKQQLSDLSHKKKSEGSKE